MKVISIISLIIFIELCATVLGGPVISNTSDKKSCGYDKCPKVSPDKLNVHIVPHTHDDVGWLKTVDQYYYGSKTMIQKAGVQYIIDSVIRELLKDPAKKFVYVESAFFSKWWNEQKPELKEKVKNLVQERRLEFIGGAWSMNDEAAVHYNSVIDQFAWGLKFLNETFGECGRPKVGWQIDPFGHSREQASLFAQMGYDGMFFARLDWQDKGNRMKTKTPEMIWHGSANLGESADLFTGVLYNHYSPPPGFCFDILCDDEPIIDNPDIPDYNVPEKVKEFLEFTNNQSKYYRTNNVMLTMGGDFNYMDANIFYSNLDKLIRYSNELHGDKYNLFYSTPTCYLKALHEANITWPEKSDDFFPYASDPHTYWTGYFTSRPTQKRYERQGNHFLQVCKQITANAPTFKPEYEKNLNSMRQIMGVMQHHDAITGTEKQHVADDYARMMHNSFLACETNVKSIFNDIYKQNVDLKNCLHLNISVCEVTETKSKMYLVSLYNPSGQARKEMVRVPVTADGYQIVDSQNKIIPIQIVPVPASVRALSNQANNFEIVFETPEIQPMTFLNVYLVQNAETKDNTEKKKKTNKNITQWRKRENDESFTIGNQHINLTFDSNGFLSEVSRSNWTKKLAQNFFWYQGAVGDNREFKNRSSGAYIFRPNSTANVITQKASVEVVEGPIVCEVHQVFTDWVSQVIRIYKDQEHIEFEWLAGPIPVKDKLGKELISRFYTTIKSDEVFYTDSNGREMLKRKRNHRETWPLELVERESGNYYPITAKIAIEDDTMRLAVLNDRAQGGSSLYDGVVELMVHRKLLNDDAFGVGEALLEDVVARGKHYVFFDRKTDEHPTQEAKERLLQADVITPFWLFFADIDTLVSKEGFDKIRDIFHEVNFANISLPKNIKLLTFEPWSASGAWDGTYLVRFEHIFELNEDPEYSKNVTINLEQFFGSEAVIRETTLDGNQWLNESVRLSFTADGSSNKVDGYQVMERSEELEINLNPMEIRTFIVKYE